MLAAPEFSSLVVSRPGSRAVLFARGRGLVVAVAFYGFGLTALLLAPLLVMEVMDPPKASVDLRVVFKPPGGHHKIPAGNIRQGTGGAGSEARPGAATKASAKKAAPRPAESLLPPPEPEKAAIDEPTNGPTGPAGPPGDPDGRGDKPNGGPGGSCLDCPDDGPIGPGSGHDGPYEQGTLGLIPPTLVPGSRALPKYPDLARRAGLQGTVILLAVIEKNGTVGEIEVVKSPDQRWGFDLAAIDAVKQWRYQPALMNGGPVAAYIQVMVEFTLAR